MKVRDLMQADSLRYCSFETSLGTAARIMKDYNVGALPVVDGEKRVRGMITDRDICLALAMNRKNPAELSVKDVMSDVKLHSVSTKDDAEDALALMRLHQIGRLPVTDRDGKLKGILSLNHLLSHALLRHEDLGSLTSDDENLARTIKAIFERNNAPSEAELYHPELELTELRNSER